MKELVGKVVQWGLDRQIIQNGKLETQWLKLLSEIGELTEHMLEWSIEGASERLEVIEKKILDDVGDSMVVCTMMLSIVSPDVDYITKILNKKEYADTLLNKALEYAEDYEEDTIKLYLLHLQSLIGDISDDIAKEIFYSYKLEKLLMLVYYLLDAISYKLPKECYAMAYEEIKDRKGTLLSSGVFVKDTDENYAEIVAKDKEQ